MTSLTNYQRIGAGRAADLIQRSRAGIQPLALFDVRDPESYSRRHIKGADHLTEADIGDTLQLLPKSTPVMIYCYHGNASQVYAGMFADFRFNQVYSVDDGFDALASTLTEAPALTPDSSRELAAFVEAYNFDAHNLNAPWEHGLTPLMRAALLGRSDLVDELLAHGVNIHLRNQDGNTALWLACVSGDTGIVQRLLDAGIDIDNRNATGATCLMYAASSGKPGMIELLLQAGADPFIATQDDYRAADLAATEECLKLLRHTLS